MTSQQTQAENKSAQYDEAWKKALNKFFPQCIEFFFPELASRIDWSQELIFLDKELQKIVRDAETPTKHVDKLVQIFYQNGTSDWVLLHLEVQSQKDTNFAERMFTYYYRIRDAYARSVTSVAILADQNKSWRVDHYEQRMETSRIRFDFTTVKLLDYDLEQLATSTNPFAVIVEAHRKAQETKKKPQQGYTNLLRIAKNLLQRGFHEQDVLELLHLVEWLFTLPSELELQYKQEIDEFQKEKLMSYTNVFERAGIEKGIQQGIQQGAEESRREDIKEVLEVRFSTVPEELTTVLEQIEDISLLKALHRQSITTASVEDFQAFLEQSLSQQTSEETSTNSDS